MVQRFVLVLEDSGQFLRPFPGGHRNLKFLCQIHKFVGAWLASRLGMFTKKVIVSW